MDGDDNEYANDHKQWIRIMNTHYVMSILGSYMYVKFLFLCKCCKMILNSCRVIRQQDDNLVLLKIWRSTNYPGSQGFFKGFWSLSLQDGIIKN